MKITPRVATILAALAFACTATIAEKAKLDRYETKFAAIAPASKVLIKTFPADNADLGTAEKKNKKKAQEIAETMVAVAPSTFTEAFVNRLENSGVFDAVGVYEDGDLPENAVLVEGEFTMLNPGSRGKRYMVGFGAGKSKICIEGTFRNAAGEELGNFGHCRTGNIGFMGGRAEGMMTTDIYKTAHRLADFMIEWAGADPPK